MRSVRCGRLISEARVQVIFYCRRWGELLPSGWQEVVKQGDIMTFPEFLSGHMVNSFGSHILNFGLTLGRYAEHFDISTIRLVSYSNIVDSREDLFVHFCQNFLGWSEPSAPSQGRSNASIDVAEVEIIRALNVLHRAHYGPKRATMFHAYLDSKTKSRSLQSDSGDPKPFWSRSDQRGCGRAPAPACRIVQAVRFAAGRAAHRGEIVSTKAV